MLRVWLDDILDPPAKDFYTDEVFHWDVACTSGQELLDLIKKGDVGFIDFDHNLSGPLTGADVAEQIEQLAKENKIGPIDWRCHTGSFEGEKRIDAAMKRAWEYWNKRKEK